MKILFVCYDGYDTTNVRVRCYRFAKELVKNKVNAEVFSFKDHLNASHDGQQSYKVSHFERLTLIIRAIKHLLKQDKRTIFYVQKSGFFSLAPLIVHFLKGNRLVLDYDDYEYEQSIISKPLLKILARRSIFCVTASKFLQTLLKKFNRKVYYVSTGVDLQIFKPSKSKATKQVTFCWMGVIVDKEALQNVLFIVNNFDKIKNKNAKLEIVGGGDHMKQVEQVIKKLSNPNIVFKGRINPDKIPSYLNTIDVGLFILLKNTKYNRSKSPTKLFEYMAKNLAIISTDVGESGKVIKHNHNGLIVKTEQDFIKSCELLAQDKKLLSKLKTNARKTVENNYNMDVIGSDLAKIMKQVH